MSKDVQPIFILPEGSSKTSGKTAQHMNIAAAKLVADQVRSTLGPKGMDKMLVDSMGDVTITNDGVTILDEMQIEHPAAKMVVEIAKTQEAEAGDGTTTAVILAGELLKNAETLLEQNVHPTIIARGFRLAEAKAQEVLNEIAEPVSVKDSSTLKSIAMTAMTGKGAEVAKEHLGSLVVKASTAVAEDEKVNLDHIKIEKKTGASVEDTELIQGIVLDKERVHPSMPKRVDKAKIALVDSGLEIKDTEIDAKIQITDPSQMQAFLDQEERMIREKVNAVIDAGASVLICQKGVDDLAQYFLAQAGVLTVRRVAKSDMEKIAMATGSTIVSSWKELNKTHLGNAGIVQEQRVGDDDMVFIQNCKNPKAVTILVKGGTEHVADEAKRALEDALGDIKATLYSGKVVAGAGAVEIEVAKHLRKYAQSLSGKEQLAVEAFANSLEVIPRTLAESAGFDPIDKIAEMRAAHDKNNKWSGIDVFTGKIKDSWKAKVLEPHKVKSLAINSSTEVAIMILRIDDVIIGGSSNAPQMPQPGMM